MVLGYDFSIYPVQNDLTADGVQYSTVVPTTTVDTDVTLISGSFDLGFDALDKFTNDLILDLLWAYFEFHVEFKANSSGTADITWKVQARNKDGDTWVDLFSAVTYADIGTSYVEKTYKGYADLQTNFEQVPFDWKIIYQCDEANEGRGRLKSTTYYRAVFKSIMDRR